MRYLLSSSGSLLMDADEISCRCARRRKDSAGLGILLGLRKHEGGELFASESARAVEECAIEIFVQSDLAGIKGGKRKSWRS